MIRVAGSLALSALLTATAAAQVPTPPTLPGAPPVVGRRVVVQAAVAAQALPIDLAAVPGNAAIVVRVNVPVVLRDKSVARLLSLAGKAGPDAVAQAFAGFVPNPLTVDRVTTALVFKATKRGDGGGAPRRDPTDDITGVAIAHTSVPFDPAQARVTLLGPGSKESKAGTVTVYTDSRGESAVTFPDAQTVVYGPADVVAAALAAPVAPGSPLGVELLNAPVGGDAPVLVTAVRANMPEKLLAELVPPELQAVARADTMAMAFSYPAQAGGDSVITVRLVYPSEAAVVQAQQAITVLSADARAKLAQGRADALKRLAGKPDRPAVRSAEELPEALGAVLQLAAVNAADEWLKDLPIVRGANTLTTAVTIPAELTPALAAGPAMIGLALPAVQKVREAAARSQSQNNLKQIGLAMHNYDSAYASFPAAAIADKQGKPLLSWRVAVLPYIEQDALYKQFKLDEPWDSDHNKKLIPLMPKTYMDPRADAPAGQTIYKVFTGKNTVFAGPKGRQITSITDGASNTILAAAGGDPVVWTKPDDIPFDLEKPVPDLSKPSPNLLVLFADGSVRVIRLDKKPKADLDKMLKLLIQPDDGQVVPNLDD